MKSRYDSLSKFRLLTGDVYQVSAFMLWWLSLPFFLLYDLIYLVLKLLYKSPTIRVFIKSVFGQIVICSLLFTLILFAPFQFPTPAVIAIRAILLLGLALFSLNGISTLDQKYAHYEMDIESKMLSDLRKQANVGIPDQQKSEPMGDSVEVLTLRVRLAELEARQATFSQELEIKRKELELRERELEANKAMLDSPLYQLKKGLEARKVLVADVETTKKEEDLGLRERPSDKDLTNEEKIAIGMEITKQASKRQIRIVRGLQQGLKDCGYPNAPLYMFKVDKVRAIVAFTLTANNPKLADDKDWLESLARSVDSIAVTARVLDKAIEFYVMNRPYNPGNGSVGASNGDIEPIEDGNNDPTLIKPPYPENN